jgi:hypothetical protein
VTESWDGWDGFQDPEKWAAAFIRAYDKSEAVKTDAGRQDFVRGWFSNAMNEAMRSVEKDPMRALLNGALTSEEHLSFGELIALAKRRVSGEASGGCAGT